MSNTVIKVENISKKYPIGKRKASSLREFIVQRFQFQTNEENTIWALKDISFEVKQGEVLGIIGKNGAGKSTLLKILSRITEPDKGRIEINGKVNSLLEVGTGFHPDLTGRENIFLNGMILGMKRREIQSKLDEIIDFSGVEKFIDTPVKHYSSGMYMRLAFSVAAHLDSEILLIDEVLAVGDYEFQKKTMQKLNWITKQGKTVFLVSHHMSAIIELSTNVLLLEKGANVQIGIWQDVLNNYLDSKVNIESKSGVFNLYNHPNKRYDSHLGFQKVEVYCNEILTRTIYTGCKFRFIISFCNDQEFKDLLFGFVIKNALGEAILGINNRHLHHPLHPTHPYKGELEVVIDKFHIFGEGEYFVDLYLGDEFTSFDIIENAFSFYLIRTNVYQSSELLNPQLNKYYQSDVKFYCV
jgi:lipopolysaccharide transport system ATP-binding protein